MKQLFYLVTLALCFSCSKKKTDATNTPDPRRVPTNYLNKLEISGSNIPPALYRDLTFINATTGFAIAEGRIVKTTDGGRNWTSIPSPTTLLLNRIQFTSAQKGYIIGGDGNSGVLLKTTDGGDTWSLSDLNTMEWPRGMYFLNDDIGFITGKNLFSKTIDGGKTWLSMKTQAWKMFQDVKFRNSMEGIATSNDGEYFKTTDGGNTWNAFKVSNANYLYDIYFVEDHTCLAKSPNEMVDISNNQKVISMPVFEKIYFFSPQKSIAVGSVYEGFDFPRPRIMYTNDGWNTYEENSPGIPVGVSAMAMMPDGKLMLLAGSVDTKILTFNPR